MLSLKLSRLIFFCSCFYIAQAVIFWNQKKKPMNAKTSVCWAYLIYLSCKNLSRLCQRLSLILGSAYRVFCQILKRDKNKVCAFCSIKLRKFLFLCHTRWLLRHITILIDWKIEGKKLWWARNAFLLRKIRVALLYAYANMILYYIHMNLHLPLNSRLTYSSCTTLLWFVPLQDITG